MEYDSESSCEGGCCSRDLANTDEPARLTEVREKCALASSSRSPPADPLKLKANLAKKSLSAQVGPNRQDCIGEEYNLKSYVPRERRRWVRPPLIGQSSNTDASTRYVETLTDLQTPSPDFKHHLTPETIHEEKNESQDKFPEINDRRLSSPTSSVASHKPLEWDSGADVGYFNSLAHNKQDDKRLSTIERMALARGCSAALRLDPEGTTESGMQSGKNTGTHGGLKSSTAPDANSTPLVAHASGSESEIEITPIVKNHLPGIITGDNIKSQERCVANDAVEPKAMIKPTKRETHNLDTPTSTFKTPLTLGKYSTMERRIVNSKHKEVTRPSSSPLQKSISMNVIPASSSKFSLKRSQSELNLHAKEKKSVLPLIFNSTSSIATVVNKPATCDKVIQTSPDVCSQESVAIQVSDLDESKSTLLTEKDSNLQTIHPILKKSSGTYKIKNTRKCENASRPVDDVEVGTRANDAQRHRSSTDNSQNASTSISPQPDETENVSGRANSFEYFPGHTYANVPNGRDSHVSSDTGRSNSTLPNSSSSVNDKLWGDSDSLVRDLERSVNILKSLVDANKCDKQVKKRLIQHVIKRLVTAKYTDDKIEHNLEDNVPWNPDDARNKVYRAQLLQALTNKHSTTESSDEWNLQKKDTSMQKSVGTTSDVIKEVALGSSNSDKFDRHTDRTEMDGRKARLGLRTDDCQRSSNTPTDPDKSESSECFVPQRNHKNTKVNDIFCFKENCKLPHRESTTTNSILPDHNRILLDAVVNNRRTLVESNNNTDNNIDWRLPTTSSERHFELKKCSMSESGDSKLVNYAEMEKRNQLIWITNEISHLCNLKKLLEQPRRLERPKSSPRKAKSANPKPKQTAILREQHGSISDTREDSVNDPWSSHCNLATREVGDPVIQKTRKRNSCTQTTTNLASAHSKTGGEIVSASRTQKPITKHISVGVQTLSREIFSTPLDSPIESEMRYMNSQKSCYQNGAKCKDQSCQTHNTARTCARCNQNPDSYTSIRSRKGDASIVSQQTQTNCANDDGATESTYPRASKNNSIQQKQKEAKNQINASKSKCSCTHNGIGLSINDNKCGSNTIEAKQINEKRSLFTCALCSEQKSITDVSNAIYNCEVCQKNLFCTRESISGSNSQTSRIHMNACECNVNVPVNDADRKIIGKSHIQQNAENQNRRGLNHNEQNDTGKNCNCANERVVCRNPETARAETLCDHCHSGDKIDNNSDTILCRFERCVAEHQTQTQIYSDSSQDASIVQQRKVQNNVLKCHCNEACFCSNNKTIKDTVKACKNYASKPNIADTGINKTERNCQHCRACGSAYQNTRKCSCHQMYPKAVAYEVSFTKENISKNEISDIIPIMPKVSKQSSSAAKFDACPCDIMKRNNKNVKEHRTSTLQDYLSRNNPEFVGNAETRRQYLSEICQLRELRKEKRIQLLAMATTSTVNKSAPIRKPTAYAQRKITDEEMKKRLRKRYLRLNEVRFKRRQQERQEEARRNKLMAKIFCKRLQQKVLRGQVNLSQSVSVISNL
ncbi:hypothetical protein ACFW04_010478 [Cataglyphis niger]